MDKCENDLILLNIRVSLLEDLLLNNEQKEKYIVQLEVLRDLFVSKNSNDENANYLSEKIEEIIAQLLKNLR